MYSNGPGRGDRQPSGNREGLRRRWFTKRDATIFGVLVVLLVSARLFGTAEPDWREAYPEPVAEVLALVTADVPVDRDLVAGFSALIDHLRMLDTAIGTLGHHDRALALEPLMALVDVDPASLLDNQTRINRGRAIMALGAMEADASAAAPLLLSVVANPSEDDAFRVVALESAVQTGSVQPAAVAVIVDLLHTPQSGSLRRAAVEAVAVIGPAAAAAVPDLTAALWDRDPRLRIEAAKALAAIGPAARSAIPALTQALDDRRPLVRMRVVESLGTFGPAAAPAVDALIGLLSEDQWAMPLMDRRVIDRDLAADFSRALENEGIDMDMARRVLEMGDGEGAILGVRASAARALGEIGPAAADAIPALTDALDDESEGMREAAANALTSIRGG